MAGQGSEGPPADLPEGVSFERRGFTGPKTGACIPAGSRIEWVAAGVLRRHRTRNALSDSAKSLLRKLVIVSRPLSRFGAVRFPSDAARARGFSGFNFVLFPSAIVAPMSVVIRDDPGVEIQRWPSP